MAARLNASSPRRNPFDRNSPSSLRPASKSFSTAAPHSSVQNQSPAPASPSPSGHAVHTRHQSFSPVSSPPPLKSHYRTQSASVRNNGSNTFAPQFIKSDSAQPAAQKLDRIEGENDFSGNRYVWLEDAEHAFIRGSVLEELPDGILLVQGDDGSRREVRAGDVDKVNPGKFDKADDMAELTHLNEASVVHNLHTRYKSDLIYTYSGLFLVAVNPYCSLPIYSKEYVKMYKGQAREDMRPHIFAVSDQAFRRLVEVGENQSILVTGESGAGKTENTKKVIQYLAAVATTDTPMTGQSPARHSSNLSQQILRANPILEAFGNAQTVRNNNSSRFGKFIRIQFSKSGQIAGAFIDWYLLEKSRVVKLNSQERNYHIFYQLLQGADQKLKDTLLLSGMDVEDFSYTRAGNDTIPGVSDKDEWNSLIEAFHIMDFSAEDQTSILKTIAAILHIGNISVVKESSRADQASLSHDASESVRKACSLLGIQSEPFIQGILHPKVKAGREWVEKTQTPEQVQSALNALSKGIYERGFGALISKINRQLDRSTLIAEESHFIGVLDIAGFEIFETNSFEQLCINYTNEKLQQFFNHHMFVLEQEEYAREQIEWQFIDFGKDLQPTIDLIELPNPIGIFSCLDEDSVMPKATDKTFTEKLHCLWDKKTPKFKPSRLSQGFILTHYAAEVEYSTDGWLEKNKDPLNDNVTRLLAASNNKHIAELFADCLEDIDEIGSPRSRVKKGLFRTVAQRHKEQLVSLMSQLHSTHPHFVRCILPNHKKRSKQFNGPLVLDQLRCNGVLEGIRIARTGFPNRLPFAEFRSRYEVLCQNMPRGYLDGQEATRIMIERLQLDKTAYRVGLTKIFFRAGVLAELEDQRDALIRDIVSRFQSIARGYTQRRIANKRLYRAQATRIIQRNLNVYLNLQDNPWWRLFVRMKPLLGVTRTAGEVKKRDEKIQKLEAAIHQNLVHRQRVEEDRRRADLELQKVQQILESERALALDKEEIFKRLQSRESELNDKLSQAIAEQETLEDELDELVDSKKAIEEELMLRLTQLEQAGQIITRLEVEKKDLVVDSQKTVEEESMLRRTQHQQASQTISRLEAEKNDLVNSKKANEDEVRLRRMQLEQAGQMISRLEAEKKDLLINSKKANDEELRLHRTQLEQANKRIARLEVEKNGLLVKSKKANEEELMLSRRQIEQAGSTISRLEAEKKFLLNKSKKENEEELMVYRSQLDQAGQIIAQLEAEKKVLLHKSKKENEEELMLHRSQLEQAGQIIAQLEAEKKSLQQRNDELDGQLDHLEKTQAHGGSRTDELEQEIHMLHSQAADLASSLSLYKTRADDYFNKLEQAEIAVLKASRAESFAKAQAKEAEETCATIIAERTQMDDDVEDLQRQTQSYKEKIEDLTSDLDNLAQAKKRLQHELEDYRSQRAIDMEDKESGIEQARQKFQLEIAGLSHDLELERENVIHSRQENSRLREELEELRGKWDDELLNSSTWAKEKSRMEITLQDVSKTRDEATAAHHEAQAKVVTLQSQVRALRSSVDDASTERDALMIEKRSLETRLSEAAARLAELATSERSSSALRTAAAMDKDLLELKSKCAQHEDVAAAAVGKMKRAEAFAAETQKEVLSEREANVALFKEKSEVEKRLKECQLRVVDLETKGLVMAGGDTRFLQSRINELELQLDAATAKRADEARAGRTLDRTVKDLETQLQRREKQNGQLGEEVDKAREKMAGLLTAIDELQSSDSQTQLEKRRVERELKEERERALRLERELEGWKGLRMERASGTKSEALRDLDNMDLGRRVNSGGARKRSGLQRKISDTKTFL